MELRVSAVLLAAGSSMRMGRSKQLLPLNNKPLIRHCLDTIVASQIGDVVVVLGADRAGIEKAIEDYRIKKVFNPDPSSDMAESLRIGLRRTDESSSGCLVCLSDHPMVLSRTIRTLIALHSKNPGRIIIPVYHGKKGHPTLFPMPVVKEVFKGHTLRDVIQRFADSVELVPVEDKGIIFDIDTMEDYKEALKQNT